jgi:hypothetical protein
MTHPSRSIIATLCGAIALLGALCLPGFGGDPQPQGSGAGNIAWERFKDVCPKAGIEKAQASFGIWKEGGLAFLIVTDFVGSSRDRGSGKGVGPEKYEGQQKARDGRKVEYQCETADGKTGTMTINGSSYQLAKGSMFLVSTRGGKVEVRQVKRDLLKVKPDQEAVEKLLKDDADVASFFAEKAKPK